MSFIEIFGILMLGAIVGGVSIFLLMRSILNAVIEDNDSQQQTLLDNLNLYSQVIINYRNKYGYDKDIEKIINCTTNEKY